MLEKLRDEFAIHGDSKANMDQSHALDNEIKGKKFGYQSSPHLTSHGIVLHFWKALLSAKSRNVSPGKKIVSLATKYNADLQEAATITKRAVWKQVRSTQKDLWTARKEATICRAAWLKENAQNIDKAAGEVDWGKR